MPKRTRSYRAWQLEQLSDPKIAAGYLSTICKEAPESFPKALGKVAQARQMAVVARGAKVSRESLYRALSDEGNPTYETLSSVLRVLGIAMEFAVGSGGSGLVAGRSPQTAGTNKRRVRRKTAGMNYQQLELAFQRAVPIPRAALAPIVATTEQRNRGIVESTAIVSEFKIRPGFFSQQQYGAGAVVGAVP